MAQISLQPSTATRLVICTWWFVPVHKFPVKFHHTKRQQSDYDYCDYGIAKIGLSQYQTISICINEPDEGCILRHSEIHRLDLYLTAEPTKIFTFVEKMVA